MDFFKGLLGLSYIKRFDFKSFDAKLKSIKFVDDLTIDDDNQTSYEGKLKQGHYVLIFLLFEQNIIAVQIVKICF